MGRKMRKICSIILAVTMAAASLGSLGSMASVQASGQTMEIKLEVGRRVTYNDYATHEFLLEDGTEAYCVEPSKRYPDSGTYTAESISNTELAKVLYYGYGGPGFKTPGIGLYYVTTEQARENEDLMLYWTHVMAAYTYGSDDAFKSVDSGTVSGLTNIMNFWKQYGSAPSNFTVYVFNKGQSARQTMTFGYMERTGYAKLKKTSSSPAITDGNACYSLEGAEYGIYANAECTMEVGTFRTDKTGGSNTVELSPGNYWVKEKKASEGYKLDTVVHQVTVTAGITNTVNVTEHPWNDPGLILMEKVDKDTGAVGQGGASLAGARFTVRYYDGYYTKDTLPEKAARTWIIETKEAVNPDTGEVAYRAYLSEEFIVGGDPLYYISGEPTLPLGTITIEETMAPSGYLLEGAYLRAFGSSEKITGLYVTTVTANGSGANLKGGNVYIMSDTAARGGVRIQKMDSDTHSAEAQGDASLAGARIDIISMNDRPVLVNGEIHEKGETVLSLMTGEDGQVQTESDALPYGHYKAVETEPPEGYLSTGITEIEFDIRENGTVLDLTSADNAIRNDVKKGSILIVKHTDNGDTGIETPEEGAVFEIYLKSAGSYADAKESERDILICDEDGFAQTKELPYGTYTVHQTDGWIGAERIEDFDVFISKDGKTYRFIINNNELESYIKVVKTDAETGKTIPYAGAGFQIYDPNGELVTMTCTYPTVITIDTFYTGQDGTLMTPEALPYGEGYALVEVQAPNGYVLDGTAVSFDVTRETAAEEDGFTVIRVEKADIPQKGIIIVNKTGEVFESVEVTEGIDGEPDTYQPVYKVRGLEGAVYEIHAAADIYTPDGTLRYSAGELVDTVTTGSDGKAASRELYLGTYTVKEKTAPYGYVRNEEMKEIILSYAGQELTVTQETAHFFNERQKAEISLVKSMEQDGLFGRGCGSELTEAEFGLYAAEVLKAVDGRIIPKDGLLEVLKVDGSGSAIAHSDLPTGSYYIREIATNDAYVLDDTRYPVDFTYAGQETAVVRISANFGDPIENELIRGDILGKKIDMDGGSLEGAKMGLFHAGIREYGEKDALMVSVSGKDGTFSFEGVPYGNYVIREIEAPEGYLLSDASYEVSVGYDGQKIIVEAVNWLLPTSPKTGDGTKAVPWAFLAGLGACGSIAVFFRRKKYRKAH